MLSDRQTSPPMQPIVSPTKSEAIHRAILAGFLGNIGQKQEDAQYVGVRGAKFWIFPGSGLFKRKPAWIVASEIVETTKLYARSIGPIKPEWVERLAPHLIHKTYSEPHWQAATGHVGAYEKITLYGLVIIPRRLVHYGPIQPVISRQLFIHHALVEMDFRSPAPFFRHNQELRDQVLAMEAKVRHRDLMAEAETRWRFFDSRLPPDVFCAPALDRWRKQIELTDPNRLFMALVDMLKPGAQTPDPALFPDEISADGITLPISYRFAPGEEYDGVTAAVPLEAINQIDEDAFDWLLPGRLVEKIEALIRTLPRPLRTQFVPVPTYAAQAAKELHFGQGSLLEALAAWLAKRSMQPLGVADFRPDELPPELHLRWEVVDSSGKPIASGRDLHQLRNQLGERARQLFARLPRGRFHRDHIKVWDFGDLPDQVEIRREGFTLMGYPALAESGEQVSLRLMDSPQSAAMAHAAGVRRLYAIVNHGEMKYLAGTLPDMQHIALNYATLGNAEQFKNEVTLAIADRVFIAGRDLPRTAAAFEARRADAWPRMSAVSNQIAATLHRTLAVYQTLQLELAEPVAIMLEPAVQDIRVQVRQLVYPGFIIKTPAVWFEHLPRFLAAALSRLHRLKNAGLPRDNAIATQINPLWQRYLTLSERAAIDPELTTYRWMIEELRVSLFAQELKSSMPISVKRVEAQWQRVMGR